MRPTIFGKRSGVGIPVTLARRPPFAVQDTGRDGRVKYPWRVTKITAHWCTPAAIEPTGAAVPPLELAFAAVCRYVKCVESGRLATGKTPLKLVFATPPTVN